MKRIVLAIMLVSLLAQGRSQTYSFERIPDISFQIYPSRDAELYARLEQAIVSYCDGNECIEIIGEMVNPDAFPKINFYRGYLYIRQGCEIVSSYESMGYFCEARKYLKKAIDSKATPKKLRPLCWELYIISGIYLIETEKEVLFKELYKDIREAKKEFTGDEKMQKELKQLDTSIVIYEKGQRFWWQVKREENLNIAIGTTQTAKEGKNENTP